MHTKKVRRRAASKVGWSPAAVNDYHIHLDANIGDIVTGLELDQRTAELDAEFGGLEKLITATAGMCSKVDGRVEESRRLCDETLSLIRQRQEWISDGCSKEVRREASKLIQTSIKKDLKAWKQRAITSKLDSSTDLKSIGSIRKNGKKSNLVSVKSKDGVRETSRQSIADVFATFYEDLYQSELNVDFFFESAYATRAVAEVTAREVDDSLQKMVKNKCSDKAGIVVEMLQKGNENLRRVIAKLFYGCYDGWYCSRSLENIKRHCFVQEGRPTTSR